MNSFPKDPDKWITHGLSVIGAFGALFGLFTYLGASSTVALAFLSGVGWALILPLLIMANRSRGEIARLEADLHEIREQSHEWRTIAKNDSDSLNKVISRSLPMPAVIPRQPHTTPSNSQNPIEAE